MYFTRIPVLAVLALLSAAPASAIPIEAILSVTPRAEVDDHTAAGGPPVIDLVTDTQSWTGVASTLSVAATATAAAAGYGAAMTFSTAEATWSANGNAGSVVLNYGWNAGPASTYAAMSTALNPPAFLYR